MACVAPHLIEDSEAISPNGSPEPARPLSRLEYRRLLAPDTESCPLRCAFLGIEDLKGLPSLVAR